MQTVFIISVCNNQLLNWIESELLWTFSFIPGVASVLPPVVAKLQAIKDKYMAATPPDSSRIKVINFFVRFLFLNKTDIVFNFDGFFFSGKTMGSFICFSLELHHMVDVVEFFLHNCYFNCSELP